MKEIDDGALLAWWQSNQGRGRLAGQPHVNVSAESPVGPRLSNIGPPPAWVNVRAEVRIETLTGRANGTED